MDGNLAQPVLSTLFRSIGERELLARFWPDQIVEDHNDPQTLPAFLRSPGLLDLQQLSDRYTGSALHFTGNHGLMRKSDRSPYELYRAGKTVYFADIAPYFEGSEEFLRTLESELGISPGGARVALFASPKGDGAPCHYDPDEVISIQLQGQKRWHVAPVTELRNPMGVQYGVGTVPQPQHYPQMSHGFPDPQNANFKSVDMRPGSVLLVPRGTWHHTEAGEESISISIAVSPPLVMEVFLEQLSCVLSQDPAWRAPLYAVRNPGPARELEAERLGRLLAGYAHIGSALTAENLLEFVKDFAERVANLNGTSRFQTIPTVRIETGGDGGGGRKHVRIINEDIAAGERELLSLQADADTVTALQWIAAQRAPFSGAALAAQIGRAFPEVQELLKVLCQRRVIVPLWFPLLSDL